MSNVGLPVFFLVLLITHDIYLNKIVLKHSMLPLPHHKRTTGWSFLRILDSVSCGFSRLVYPVVMNEQVCSLCYSPQYIVNAMGLWIYLWVALVCFYIHFMPEITQSIQSSISRLFETHEMDFFMRNGSDGAMRSSSTCRGKPTSHITSECKMQCAFALTPDY